MTDVRLDCRAVVVPALLLAVGVLVSVVAVLPGVRAVPGFDPLVDGWIKTATYLLVAQVVTLRAVLRAEGRRAWAWLAAGYVLQAVGFAAWLGWVRWQDPVPYPSIADAAWLLTAPAFLAGLVLLVRDRWPRRSLAVLSDALAGAAVAAAVTIAASTRRATTRPTPSARPVVGGSVRDLAERRTVDPVTHALAGPVPSCCPSGGAGGPWNWPEKLRW